MPHVVLEYSANALDEPDFPRLLLSIHESLAATGCRVAEVRDRADAEDERAVGAARKRSARAAKRVGQAGLRPLVQ